MRGFKYNTETFIERAREIHTDIDYDYSKVEYIHSQTKITIVDPIYGEFHITPNNFLCNHIHPARSGLQLQPKTTASFIQEAKHKRTDIDFDYSKVKYVNSKTKVTIIDPDYGEFQILPKDLLRRKSRHPARCGKGNKKDTLTKDKLSLILKGMNENK